MEAERCQATAPGWDAVIEETNVPFGPEELAAGHQT